MMRALLWAAIASVLCAGTGIAGDVVAPSRTYDPLVVCERGVRTADPIGPLACWNAYYEGVTSKRYEYAAAATAVGCDDYRRLHFCDLNRQLARVRANLAKGKLSPKAAGCLPTALDPMARDDAEIGFMMTESPQQANRQTVASR